MSSQNGYGNDVRHMMQLSMMMF